MARWLGRGSGRQLVPERTGHSRTDEPVSPGSTRFSSAADEPSQPGLAAPDRFRVCRPEPGDPDRPRCGLTPPPG
jgi:hypothetical protein